MRRELGLSVCVLAAALVAAPAGSQDQSQSGQPGQQTNQTPSGQQQNQDPQPKKKKRGFFSSLQGDGAAQPSGNATAPPGQPAPPTPAGQTPAGQAPSGQGQDQPKKKPSRFFSGLKAISGQSSPETEATVTAGSKSVGEGEKIGAVTPSAADRQQVGAMESYSVPEQDLKKFQKDGRLESGH